METPEGHFCWADLAATDAQAAGDFYERLFGWRPERQAANGGHFVRLRLGGRDVGSLYQLGREALESGAASHWLLYVHVTDVEEAARRAESLGGRTLVRPFEVSGVARIAVIADAVGAPLGLWEPLHAGKEEGPPVSKGP
jgi:predicted enzyme related to lactoylglutathione lyase